MRLVGGVTASGATAELIPAEEVGCLDLDRQNRPVTPDPAAPEFSKLRRHFGSVRDAWPAIRKPHTLNVKLTVIRCFTFYNAKEGVKELSNARKQKIHLLIINDLRMRILLVSIFSHVKGIESPSPATVLRGTKWVTESPSSPCLNRNAVVARVARRQKPMASTALRLKMKWWCDANPK